MQAAALGETALRRLEAYAQLLATRGIEHGLLGPGELPRLWERHLLNCAVLAELVSGPGPVVDVGSGAGLPGVVVAVLRPSAAVVLVESMARRAAFLTDAVAELGLANVTVQRARAEELAGTVQATYVLARAVAPLARLAELTAPLLAPDGVVLALKGAGVQAELAAAGAALRRHRLVAQLLELTPLLGAEPARVVRLRLRSPA